jgi:hypothetical protein
MQRIIGVGDGREEERISVANMRREFGISLKAKILQQEQNEMYYTYKRSILTAIERMKAMAVNRVNEKIILEQFFNDIFYARQALLDNKEHRNVTLVEIIEQNQRRKLFQQEITLLDKVFNGVAPLNADVPTLKDALYHVILLFRIELD